MISRDPRGGCFDVISCLYYLMLRLPRLEAQKVGLASPELLILLLLGLV